MSEPFRPHVVTAGEGEPLVLVHGSWTDHTSWQLVLPALAADHFVVAYDRRGHSRSEWAQPVLRRQDEDDLAQLITALGRGPVHLVGNSYGGSIALHTAARYPELVRSVAAHEPPLLGVARPGTRLAELRATLDPVLDRVVADLAAGRPADGARRFVDDLVLGPGAWEMLPPPARDAFVSNASTFLGMLEDPAWGDVTETATGIPVLLTDGAASPDWLRAIVDELAGSAYRHAERTTFDGAGHAPHLTHPDDVVAVVRRFVGDATDGAGALSRTAGTSRAPSR